MSNIGQLVLQLKSNPEFNELLQQKFKTLASGTMGAAMVRPQRRTSQTPSVGDLIDDITETFGEIVKFHAQDGLDQVKTLAEALQKLREDVDTRLVSALEQIARDHDKLMDTMKLQIGTVNDEIASDRKKNQKKFSTLGFAFETMLANIHKEDGSPAINFDGLKLLESSCIEDKSLQFTKSKICEKSSEEIEKDMSQMEARLQQKYETNINSIWKVVVQLQKKIQRGNFEDQFKHMKKVVSNAEPRKRRFGWMG